LLAIADLALDEALDTPEMLSEKNLAISPSFAAVRAWATRMAIGTIHRFPGPKVFS